VNIDLLVDFLNTDDSGVEVLTDDDAGRRWFREHGLPTKGLDVREARRVRASLRCAVEGEQPVWDVGCVPLYAEVVDGGLDLVSKHPLGEIVATAVRLAFEGRWHRLKLCEADTCRYAFYDGSKNRSGKWCSMAICGNRAKTKAFRERHGS
jgi:hypothetical protein